MPTFTDHSHIRGWGVDADPARRPAYPKERMPARWSLPEPEQQIQSVPILHSTERPGITPVFGTSTPPSGISGMLRRLAFRYSENDIRHWLVLLFADRVNVGEGLASDLAHGHIPNLYREMGGPAEFRHNRSSAVRKLAVVGGITMVTVYLWRRDRRRPF
jgi:hypothetical protein